MFDSEQPQQPVKETVVYVDRDISKHINSLYLKNCSVYELLELEEMIRNELRNRRILESQNGQIH